MDSNNLSLKEIYEGIRESLDVKRINVRLYKAFFWLLTKLKPNIVLRLYGSLQFENNSTREKLDYIPRVSYKDGVKKMVSF